MTKMKVLAFCLAFAPAAFAYKVFLAFSITLLVLTQWPSCGVVLGVVASAVFLSAIFVGADSMSRAINVPSYLADVVTAVSLLLVLMSVMLVRYRIRRS